MASTGTYLIAASIILLALFAALGVWLDNLRRELRRLMRRNLERRLWKLEIKVMECRERAAEYARWQRCDLQWRSIVLAREWSDRADAIRVQLGRMREG